jgi:hypothetical protein
MFYPDLINLLSIILGRLAGLLLVLVRSVPGTGNQRQRAGNTANQRQ